MGGVVEVLIRCGIFWAAAAATACTIAGAAPAAPERNELIRMGQAIGKIKLGMTLPAVRRALGPNRVVYRRHDFGARGRYVELGWERPGRVSWEPVIWQVGFRSWRRGGTMRVVRVATDAPSERTSRRLGVGSRPRQLVRAYPHATCVSRGPEGPYRFDWVVVEERNGAMTAFNLDTFVGADYGGDENLHKVVAVMVQRDWFSKGAAHRPCPPGWERW
jgi:hypothetical protein